jgi:putative transposase
MVIQTGRYYHLYNRSNNEEKLFKEESNYLYFLERYRFYLSRHVLTLAYCLMPTHFHLVMKVVTDDCPLLKKNYAAFLSGYTKTINRWYHRHGSLFQPRSKAKEIKDEEYLLTLVNYVHQNPLRSKLVRKLKDWKFSSYPDLAGFRSGDLPDREFFRQYFSTIQDFRNYSEKTISR